MRRNAALHIGTLVAVVLVAALALVTTPLGPASATTLPRGFTQTRVASGFARPEAMALAPDGRVFISLQGGAIRIVKKGRLLATPFLKLDVDSHGDRGVIGMAFDAHFATDHYVYVYYTATSPTIHNRVSRFTADGDVAVDGSEHVLFNVDPLGPSGLHNGGSLQFRGGGKLYISTGDNVQLSAARSMNSTLGKILRINRNGTIPVGNPFYDTARGRNRAIWALGLRNPFTTALQRGRGPYFINDVGASTWEEINRGKAGADYGWPIAEGVANDPRFVDPIYAYPHGTTGTTGCAIAGGAFYNPPKVRFPKSYVGTYFYADHCSAWIRVLDPVTQTSSSFVTAADGPINVQTAPNGSLYYLGRTDATGVGSLYRIRYSAPPASATSNSVASTIRDP
jgi:glucose/arabinose dehydrogenase